MAANSSWRLKNRKLEPYWENAVTELAERTMTRPSTVRAATEKASVTTTRLALRSAFAFATAGGTSSRWTTRRRGARITASLRMGSPRGRRFDVVSARPATEQRAGGGGETVSALAVIAEHVLARAGRRQQHRAARRRPAVRDLDGLLDGSGPLDRHQPGEDPGHHRPGLSDGHHGAQAAGRRRQGGQVHPLRQPSRDQHDVGHPLEGG